MKSTRRIIKEAIGEYFKPLKWIRKFMKKESCPHAGKKYCEYPYCNCKEKKPNA